MNLSTKMVLLAAATATVWSGEATRVTAWETEPKPAPAAPVALPRDILTNDGVVTLAEAGFSDSFIAEKILLSRTRFDTSAEGLANLRRHEVSEDLIQFLLRVSAKPVPQLAPPPQKKGLLAKLPFIKKPAQRASAPRLALPAKPVLTEPAIPKESLVALEHR